MLARAAVPGGAATGGTSGAEGAASPAPQISGSADIPDREVCAFILLVNVLSGECQLLWDETILSY